MVNMFVRTLALVGALAGSPLAMAAYTAPEVDMGVVDTWAVVQQDFSKYDYTNQQTLDFTLAADSTVRIDMRAVEHSWKYDASTFNIVDAGFQVFDAGHVLIGSSSIDSLFSEHACTNTPSSGGVALCASNYGLTFGGSLAAGSYTIEFSMDKLGTYPPTVKFGVAIHDPGTLSAYLTAVSPVDTVPEATTGGMMALGLALLGLVARARSKGRAT